MKRIYVDVNNDEDVEVVREIIDRSLWQVRTMRYEKDPFLVVVTDDVQHPGMYGGKV